MPRSIQHLLEDESSGAERWLVSYSDLVTLLFAFFVVMYSISSVNEGKYRILSDTLVDAFRQELERPVAVDMGGLPGGDGVFDGGRGLEGTAATMLNQLEEAGLSAAELTLPEVPTAERFEDAQTAASFLKSRLAPLIERDDLRVREGADWIEIELSSALLFKTGSADLTGAARQPLVEVAKTITKIEHALPVRIEGHTDDRPIATARYPSNWELSAARAASVVRVLNAEGIAADRLSAIGYGDARPRRDNATAAGRRENRRVVIALAAAESVGTRGAAGPAAPDRPAAARHGDLELQRVTRLPGLEGIP